jgi:hypothetical protein
MRYAHTGQGRLRTLDTPTLQIVLGLMVHMGVV